MQSGGGDRLPAVAEHAVSTESTAGAPTPPATQAQLEQLRQTITDAIAELDGHALPADVRKEFSW